MRNSLKRLAVGGVTACLAAGLYEPPRPEIKRNVKCSNL